MCLNGALIINRIVNASRRLYASTGIGINVHMRIQTKTELSNRRSSLEKYIEFQQINFIPQSRASRLLIMPRSSGVGD